MLGAMPDALHAAPIRALPSQAQLTEVLVQLRAEYDLPGLRAALRSTEGSVAAATGWADVEQEIPLTPQIGMPGGSTGKTFVATTAMLLVEQHALELDDPISLYVGERRWFSQLAGAEHITVAHLLNHTAGVPDHVDDTNFGLSLLWRRITGESRRYTPDELIEFILDNGLQSEPGTTFLYSDTGYLMLGQVLESAMSMRYYDILQEQILTPHDLAARPQTSRTMDSLSVGYVDTTLLSMLAGISGRNMRDGELTFDPSSEWTGGGLVTTPDILASFYHKLANGKIVRAQSFELMRTQGVAQEQGWHYGFGMYVGEASVGHGGWYPGYSTDVRHFLDDNLTIAVQTNTDREFPIHEIRAALRELTLGVNAVQ